MSGAILRRRDRTGQPLRVEHYSAAVNSVEVKMVLQEPFTQGEGTEINAEMELCWAPEDTVILGHRDARQS